MTHQQVYSAVDVKALLHFVRLGHTISSNETAEPAWWPCLWLNNMMELDAIAKQLSICQSTAHQLDSGILMMYLNHVPRSATCKVALLLGDAPPVRCIFDVSELSPLLVEPFLDKVYDFNLKYINHAAYLQAIRATLPILEAAEQASTCSSRENQIPSVSAPSSSSFSATHNGDASQYNDDGKIEAATIESSQKMQLESAHQGADAVVFHSNHAPLVGVDSPVSNQKHAVDTPCEAGAATQEAKKHLTQDIIVSNESDPPVLKINTCPMEGMDEMNAQLVVDNSLPAGATAVMNRHEPENACIPDEELPVRQVTTSNDGSIFETTTTTKSPSSEEASGSDCGDNVVSPVSHNGKLPAPPSDACNAKVGAGSSEETPSTRNRKVKKSFPSSSARKGRPKEHKKVGVQRGKRKETPVFEPVSSVKKSKMEKTTEVDCVSFDEVREALEKGGYTISKYRYCRPCSGAVFASENELRQDLCAYGVNCRCGSTEEKSACQCWDEEDKWNIKLWVRYAVIRGDRQSGEVPEINASTARRYFKSLGFTWLKSKLLDFYCFPGVTHHLEGKQGLTMFRTEVEVWTFLSRFGLPQNCNFENLTHEERLSLEYFVSTSSHRVKTL
jgi:hypothetical protein